MLPITSGTAGCRTRCHRRARRAARRPCPAIMFLTCRAHGAPASRFASLMSCRCTTRSKTKMSPIKCDLQDDTPSGGAGRHSGPGRRGTVDRVALHSQAQLSRPTAWPAGRSASAKACGARRIMLRKRSSTSCRQRLGRSSSTVTPGGIPDDRRDAAWRDGVQAGGQRGPPTVSMSTSYGELGLANRCPRRTGGPGSDQNRPCAARDEDRPLGARHRPGHVGARFSRQLDGQRADRPGRAGDQAPAGRAEHGPARARPGKRT